MSESESRGTLRFALFLLGGLAVAVGILAAISDGQGQDAVHVEVGIAWVSRWIGLLFVLLAPLAGLWMLRTRDIGWVVLLPVALFLAGASLLGLGAWGPYVGLAAVALGATAIVIGRPADDDA